MADGLSALCSMHQNLVRFISKQTIVTMNYALRLKAAPERLIRCRYYGSMGNKMIGRQARQGLVARAMLPSVTSFEGSCKSLSGGSYSISNLNTSARRTIHSTTVSLKEYPSHQVFPMPALSPTMEMGSIASWNLNVGDSFSAGDVLCSVETDKATIDFEAQDDGILAKILREPPNATDIPIGVPICVVVEEEEDVAAFADFTVDADSGSGSGAPAASPAAEVSPAAAAAPAATSSPTEHPLLPSARFLSESKYVAFDSEEALSTCI